MQFREDLKDITWIVATHNRNFALKELIDSLNIHYPKMPLFIVDSSEFRNNNIDLTNYIYTHNSWISLQRNIALDKVKTNLFLLLDDDYIFNNKTNIKEMLELMIKFNHQIVWWWVNNINTENFDFHWIYEIIDEVLYHFIDYEQDVENKKYDTIFNFFLAETNAVKAIWWRDSSLKYAREHDDFFLSAKEKNMSVWYTNKVSIDHNSYAKYHWWERSRNCVNYFLNKRNIKNKIEIRLINRIWNEPYISYHNCIHKTDTIPDTITKKIRDKYWDFTIKIS